MCRTIANATLFLLLHFRMQCAKPKTISVAVVNVDYQARLPLSIFYNPS